jgi:hypothetical protein
MKLFWLSFILPFVLAEDAPIEESGDDRGWVAKGGNAYNGYEYIPGVTPFDVKPVNAHTGRDIARDPFPNPFPYNGVPNPTAWETAARDNWWGGRWPYPGPYPRPYPMPGPVYY